MARKMNKVKLFLILLVLISQVGCGSSDLIVSKSVDKEITIDGNQEDWNGNLTFMEDEKLAVGFQNDSIYLYLCLTTSDRSNVMKILSLGLTVWFEPDNGEKIIGLRYPQKLEKVNFKNLAAMNNNKQDKYDFETIVETMLQYQNEYSIVNEDDYSLYAFPIGNKNGFELKAGTSMGQFVYEAKIPIANNGESIVLINVLPGEKLNVGFETGEFDMDEMRKNMSSSGMTSGGMSGGGRSGGGRSGGGKSGAGRGGQRSGSGSGEMAEQIDFWTEVKLSK